MSRFRVDGDRGSVAAWMAIVPVLVVLLGGIAVDLWAALSVHTRLAALADDAAAAGATALDEGALRGGAAVLAEAAAHGRAVEAVRAHPDAALVTDVVASADATRVTVVVTGAADLSLLSIVGIDAIPLTVEGAATPTLRGP